MPTANELLLNSFASMVANTQRVSETEALTVIGSLRSLEKNITATLSNSINPTNMMRRQFNALVSDTRSQIGSTFQAIGIQHHAFLAEVGGLTQAATNRAFSRVDRKSVV